MIKVNLWELIGRLASRYRGTSSGKVSDYETGIEPTIQPVVDVAELGRKYEHFDYSPAATSGTNTYQCSPATPGGKRRRYWSVVCNEGTGTLTFQHLAKTEGGVTTYFRKTTAAMPLSQECVVQPGWVVDAGGYLVTAINVTLDGIPVFDLVWSEEPL